MNIIFKVKFSKYLTLTLPEIKWLKYRRPFHLHYSTSLSFQQKVFSSPFYQQKITPIGHAKVYYKKTMQ